MAAGGSHKWQLAVSGPSFDCRGADSEQLHCCFGADPFRHVDGMLHWRASTGYPIFGNPCLLTIIGRFRVEDWTNSTNLDKF